MNDKEKGHPTKFESWEGLIHFRDETEEESWCSLPECYTKSVFFIDNKDTDSDDTNGESYQRCLKHFKPEVLYPGQTLYVRECLIVKELCLELKDDD